MGLVDLHTNKVHVCCKGLVDLHTNKVCCKGLVDLHINNTIYCMGLVNLYIKMKRPVKFFIQVRRSDAFN